jgi:hypothetical protein
MSYISDTLCYKSLKNDHNITETKHFYRYIFEQIVILIILMEFYSSISVIGGV